MTVEVNNANVIAFINGNSTLHAIALEHPGANQPLIDACNGTTGIGAGTVAGDPVSASQLLTLLDADDLQRMSTQQIALLTFYTSVQTLDLGDASIQSKLNAVLATYATSKAAVQAKYTRPGSLWEVHFGKGLVCDQVILDTARNSGSGNNF
jgi:hypothetical protein